MSRTVRGLLGLAAAAVAAFVTGLVIFQLGMLAFVRSGAETQVPALVGLDVTAARAALEQAGFAGVVDREIHTGDFGEGRVAAQRPEAGEVLRRGRKVWLTVSLGLRKADAPSVVGMTARQAGIVLDREGLRAGEVVRVPHPRVARGDVVAQDPPAGAPCAEGADVDLLVSLGPSPEAWVLPDLTGRPVRDVERLLAARDVEVGERTVLIDRSVLPSTVLEQVPGPGARIESGQAVDLVVSSRR